MPGRFIAANPAGANADPHSTAAARTVKSSGRPMLTLPNILTLSRIVAVPLLVLMLWPGGGWFDYALTFALYCLVGITDYFDGYVARARGAVSRLGIFLDPIADKIMVAAVIMMLASTRAHSDPVIHGLHIVPALVILIREIAVSGLR